MKLGIVGHEAAKFTDRTEKMARYAIQNAINSYGATTIVSGRCPLGGIDIWAEEQADAWLIDKLIFAPSVHQWNGAGGYRARNLQIAKNSDVVLVIALRELPPEYKGMRFKTCYHCKDRNPPHVKGGGCWTAWKARERTWRIIE